MNFGEKPPEELKKQVKKVEEILGVPIAPEPLENLDNEKIQSEYRARYDSYVAVLRESKKETLNTAVVDHARERITALNNLNEFIISHHTENGDARGERQASVYKDTQAFLERGEISGYIKLPTGVGKTVIFSHLVEALGLKTVIAVPTKIIVGQTGEKLEQFTDVEFGKFFSHEKNLDDLVTITTYASLVARVKDGTIDPNNVPALILDEVHRALGEETRKVIEQFRGIRIGFTATDTFSDKRNVSNLLGEKIHSMDLREAIQEGSLCTTQTIHAHTTIDLSSVPMVGDEYHQGALEKAVNTAVRNKAAVELYREGFMGRKTVCNCSGVKHAETLAKIFNEQGISSAVIHAGTPEKSNNGVMGREEILEKFANGEILVLCNAKVLVEGFDSPACSVAFNLHPTRSLVDAEQRGGRALRLDPNNPDKVGCVVDFIDINKKKKPVLFSEILGGNVVVPQEKNTSGGIGNAWNSGKRIPFFAQAIPIEGLRISVDPQEILFITKEYRESREAKEFDFVTLQKEVQEEKIENSVEYEKVAPFKGWMSRNALVKQSEWISWDDFLGREKFNFTKLQKEVQEAGIRSSYQYQKIASSKGWMSFVTLVKQPEWISWDDFLNREAFKHSEFQRLQKEVQEEGIETSREYTKIASSKGWMSFVTLVKQPEWISWDDFLGRESFDFVTFQKEVQAAGIKSSKEYGVISPSKKWMNIKALRSKPEWTNWDDFLGRKK